MGHETAHDDNRYDNTYLGLVYLDYPLSGQTIVGGRNRQRAFIGVTDGSVSRDAIVLLHGSPRVAYAQKFLVGGERQSHAESTDRY